MEDANELVAVAVEPQAAVDISTGYGADTYLSKSKHQDPWAPDCFRAVVELAVNYPGRFCYPWPSMVDALKGSDPAGVSKLLSRLEQRGLLRPYPGHAASDVLDFATSSLDEEYESFLQWADHNGGDLKTWVNVHWPIRQRIHYNKPENQYIESKVEQFWKQKNPVQLLSEMDMASDELLFAFDVMVRGKMYYKLLDPKIFYFPHPLRHPLLPTAHVSAINKGIERYGYSWGRVFVRLVQRGEKWRDPDRLAGQLKDLQQACVANQATWSTLVGLPLEERHKRLELAASQSGLPGEVRDEALVAIGVFIGALALCVKVLIPETQLIHPPKPIPPLLLQESVRVALDTLELALGAWKLWPLKSAVPGGIVKKATFFRGLLEWPGLYKDD